jgi:hypothetical protein
MCDSVTYSKNGWEFSSGGKIALTVKDSGLIHILTPDRQFISYASFADYMNRVSSKSTTFANDC